MKKRIIITFTLWLGLYFSSLITPEAQEAFFKLKVVTEQANIRLKPDIGSEIIRQVPQGTILESTGKEGEWYVIKLETEEGQLTSVYVHESLVLRIQPAVEEEIVEEKKEEKTDKPKIQPSPFIPIPKKTSEPSFALSIYGGGNYVSGQDLNRGAKGFVQFYRDELGTEGRGEASPLHLSYIFGGELSIPLSSQFLLGIGFDYFIGKKESSIEYQKSSFKTTITTLPKIQAFPLRVVVSYYPLPYLFFKGGIEYYFAQCFYFYRLQEGDYWKEWQGEARSQGLGFLGGLGTEWNFSPYLSFIIEANGRYAKIRGFKGKDTSRDSEGLDYTEKGTLYLYQAITSSQNAYPQLFIREKTPAEGWVTDPRQAFIDFSGISLKLGIRIKF